MRKQILSFWMAVLVAWTGIGAAAAGVTDHITVNSYDPQINYMAAMLQALEDGSAYALQVGAIYEQQRNLKIGALQLPQKLTYYFTTYKTAEEILAAMEADKRPKYTQDDLTLLAAIMHSEAGCTWIPDWVQLCVGSVVLNRVKSDRFPNTIKEVLDQPGQYRPTSGLYLLHPDARTVENARYLLENGSITPDNVVWQNGIITGSGIYKSYYDRYLGSTTYFCYL